jgi:hypothetical protein
MITKTIGKWPADARTDMTSSDDNLVNYSLSNPLAGNTDSASTRQPACSEVTSVLGTD